MFNRTVILAGFVLGMGLGSSAQDEPKAKSGQEKVAFEKASYPYSGEITARSVNVRLFLKTDDKDGLIVGVLGEGTRVTVVGEKADWLQVSAPKGCHVWVSTRNIRKDSATEGTVLANDTPVRLDSRVNADKICGLNEGEKVAIVKEHMGWFQIQAPDAVKYFVSRKYVKFVEEVKVAVNAKSAPAIDAKTGDALANDLIKQAQAVLDDALKAIGADSMSIRTVSYMPAVDLFQKAAESAVSNDLKKFAASKADDARKTESARLLAVTKLDEIERNRLEREKANKPEAPAYDFMGYVDTVGPVLNRPGTHKLVMAGRVVCFLKATDEEMRVKFNGLYQRYVGVKGKVTRDPEGWTGYAVIEVESVSEVLKKD
jgi:hypothetical protein